MGGRSFLVGRKSAPNVGIGEPNVVGGFDNGGVNEESHRLMAMTFRGTLRLKLDVKSGS